MTRLAVRRVTFFTGFLLLLLSSSAIFGQTCGVPGRPACSKIPVRVVTRQTVVKTEKVEVSNLIVISEPEATISLRLTLGGKIVSKAASREGIAVFDDLTPGLYNVSASLDGFQTTETDSVTVLSQQSTRLSLSLKRITTNIVLKTNIDVSGGEVVYAVSTISGKDANGRPIFKKATKVSSLVEVNEDGEAELPFLNNGYYELKIRAPGYQTKSIALNIPGDLGDDGAVRIDLENENVSRGAELIRVQPTVARRGRYYALIIGNNDYKGFSKLETAVGDATEINRILRAQYGFETKILLNATREQILDEFTSFETVLSPEDSLLVYYAGHGIFDEKRDQMYWLPIDAASRNGSWISKGDILSNLKASPAKHILVISDSCYAGMAIRDVSEEVQTQRDRKASILRLLSKSSKRWIGSGNNEPVTDSGGKGHSIFAQALINGLSSPEVNEFTAMELFSKYLITRVAAGATQTPVYRFIPDMDDNGGDFVFIRKNP